MTEHNNIRSGDCSTRDRAEQYLYSQIESSHPPHSNVASQMAHLCPASETAGAGPVRNTQRTPPPIAIAVTNQSLQANAVSHVARRVCWTVMESKQQNRPRTGQKASQLSHEPAAVRGKPLQQLCRACPPSGSYTAQMRRPCVTNTRASRR